MTSPPVTHDLAVRVEYFLNHGVRGEDDVAHKGTIAGCKISIAGIESESVPTE